MDRGPASQIRNVLLISIDTCRADHLSSYGNVGATTPNIDAIARDGVLFTRAQSTNPITLPAHCSMLTGTNPTFHGVHLNDDPPLDDTNVTLAEVVRDHGFQTAAVIGSFPLHSRFGLDQGFDSYDEQFSKRPERLFYNERDAQEVSRTAIRWLEQRLDKPFFLFVHYFDPHQPYEPPKPFASDFGDNPYAGEIAFTDLQIGRLIEKLKKLDLFDSTLVIITADHGESLGEHNEDSHAFFIYQSTIRVPLIIKGPGLAAGREVNDAVSLIDIVPTVLGLLDLPVPPQVQGVNLSGYLRGRSAPVEDRLLYSESWYPAGLGCSPLRGLVHGKWRFIWSVRPELYDLDQDPDETDNLIEAQPKVASLLQSRLQEMLADQRRIVGDRRLSVPDRQTAQRLATLGYVGGPVVDAAFEMTDDKGDPKNFIGIYKRFLAARRNWGQKRLAEAKAQCHEILKRRPKLLPVTVLLGSIAVDEGRMADAVKHYSHVLAVAAEAKNRRVYALEVYKAHSMRGNAYEALGNDALALNDFNKAIALKPDSAEAYNNRGNIHTKLGNFDAALSDYNRAIELEPDNAITHYNRGNFHLQLGRFELAASDYTRAIELNPDLAGARNNRANAYRQLRRFDQALADFTRAIELMPDDVFGYYNRAGTYRQMGRYDDALADLARAI